jgi:hypothetical protein
MVEVACSRFDGHRDKVFSPIGEQATKGAIADKQTLRDSDNDSKLPLGTSVIGPSTPMCGRTLNELSLSWTMSFGTAMGIAEHP